jgi:hypothetical protein
MQKTTAVSVIFFMKGEVGLHIKVNTIFKCSFFFKPASKHKPYTFKGRKKIGSRQSAVGSRQSAVGSQKIKIDNTNDK